MLPRAVIEISSENNLFEIFLKLITEEEKSAMFKIGEMNFLISEKFEEIRELRFDGKFMKTKFVGARKQSSTQMSNLGFLIKLEF